MGESCIPEEGGGAAGSMVAFWTLMVATCTLPPMFMDQLPPVCWPSSVRLFWMRDCTAHWVSPQLTAWPGTPHAVMLQLPLLASSAQPFVCSGCVAAGMLQEPLAGAHLGIQTITQIRGGDRIAIHVDIYTTYIAEIALRLHSASTADGMQQDFPSIM